MGTLILRWFLSKKVRQAVDMCRQVRKLIGAQRDLLSPEEIQEISKAARELSNAIASGDRLEGIEKRMKNLEKVANENLKPYPSASLRENIEVFLVTGAVVLALRTFFFQPMAIPSGSAQPTLWGITSENLLGRPDVKIPSGQNRLVQTCWAGTHYYQKVAENEGEMKIDPARTILPFLKRQVLWVGAKDYPIWFPPEDLEGRTGLRDGQMIQENTTVSSSLRFTAIGNDVSLPSGISSPQHSTSFKAPCSLKTTAAASACLLYASRLAVGTAATNPST